MEAEKVRQTILTALAGGQTFADAAKAAGQTATDLPPFTLSEPPYNIQGRGPGDRKGRRLERR